MAGRRNMERTLTSSSITVISQPDSSTDNIRVAVSLAVNNKIPPVMEIMSRQSPLVNIVKDLCKKFKLEDPSLYHLQFDETHVQPPPIYITEENRDKMKDGHILKLDFSPQQMSKTIVDGFADGTISKEKIDHLAKLAVDVTFVEKFVTQNGFTYLAKFIEGVAKSRVLSQNSGPALSAFIDIMDHSIVAWETISESFLDCILWFIESKTEPDLLVIKSCLEILECAILNSTIGKSFATEGRINIDQFISTLKTRDIEIQVSCVSLINTILDISSTERQEQIRKKLLSSPTRLLVWETIFTGPIGNDMGYQLYSLQTRLSNLLSGRLNGAIDLKDPAALKEISELRHTAFDDDVEAAGGSHQQLTATNETRDYTKLGFKNPAEPLMEFNQAPPGALALDCMAFFAQQYTQQYRQVVLENSRERADDQDCPFAQASVQLTQLLADILNIGEPPCAQPGQDDRTYYPMFFFKEKPFEECFCVCIQRLMRTWKEMKASLSDFNKVLMVVKEQIMRALNEKPHTFDSLKTKLTNWSFAKIQEARQEELERKEEIKRQAKPIKELREMIRPELEEVIRQQRINRMIDGCHFKPPARSTKAIKSVYWKLSQNGKVLHYGNAASDRLIPEVLQAINILDICEVKENDDARTRIKAIILVKQDREEMQLIAENQRDHDIWLDGLHALTGLKPVNSEQAKCDLDELLSMEVKLRLLDAEGISFPDDPPPIPQPPNNFNFATA